MNLRRWFFLFWTALLIGAAGALGTGLIMMLVNGEKTNGLNDFLLYLLILFGSGVMISVYSQMGFFAYLILNYMGKGVFPKRGWQIVQIVLTVLALLDVMFLRLFVGGDRERISDIVLGIIILAAAIVTAYVKVKLTHISALVPTLFFMIAVTIVETIGVLRIDVNAATIFIVVPLLLCNAYQMLILHRLVDVSTNRNVSGKAEQLKESRA
ncbi:MULTISPECIES: KinB-signaling pathway activation protein [Paenibacillus]|uniref:KinB-signaling pathway activation protein n=1 Tax=Paenibacillus TaxID=44249 RepID=UPI000B818AA2|nr:MULTISPECIES: KinB-signaling pathway activation protein [Paenibacillus]MBD8842240.1 KinB-signaling pathway activation protein [Paenibacillus sp. CFBP 13594]PQZ97433.1 KinB signaling pathway activation protein [Paenibacillus sp. MYb63]PRA41316.1 KinB signaling pathway activation protein [Paenibacillus sp. MYb67]QZN76418.1 KinB-signaling pathway activation protein [Paenibacillus sp. DR312]